MTTEVFVGDVGTLILFKCLEQGAVLNISQAQNMLLKILRKDKTLVTLNAGLYTDGSDGYLSYITSGSEVPAVFVGKGRYKAQAYLEIPGWKGHTDEAVFSVGEPVG